MPAVDKLTVMWEDDGKWTLSDLTLKEGKYVDEDGKPVAKLYVEARNQSRLFFVVIMLLLLLLFFIY